ncbi:MAG: hypothetical protein LIO65_05540, partial [Odoribacter sp.]|nr:hypothetical protein [Odoribacter sp.]
QFVDFGQDPDRFKLKQIKTENFQIIYPDFFEDNVQKMANIYHILYHSANSLNHKPGKMSMIVHPGGGISNGSVGWAPKKSDLYTMLSQDPTDSWLEHLCIHEFRHIVQLDKVNQGFTKALYYIFGEQLPIAISGVFLPMWFIEGDAVTYESSIGYLGRGRSPEFINEMKAQILEKGIYSYDKAVLGSSKDYIPNRYNLGYLMVGNARKNYGSDIWANAVQQVGRKPYTFVPFRRSLKKTLIQQRDSLWQDSVFTSLFVNADSVKATNWRKDAKVTLYKDNFSELREIWKKEVEKINVVYDTIPTNNKYYTNYYYPTPLQDGSIIAFKKGFRET